MKGNIEDINSIVILIFLGTKMMTEKWKPKSYVQSLEDVKRQEYISLTS